MTNLSFVGGGLNLTNRGRLEKIQLFRPKVVALKPKLHQNLMQPRQATAADKANRANRQPQTLSYLRIRQWRLLKEQQTNHLSATGRQTINSIPRCVNHAAEQIGRTGAA